MLGIDNITKYSKMYGLGSHTGIETGDAEGYLCNPETFEEHGQEWVIGNVIQAGIGNQDCGITPLQMAVVASTIGNRGVRYKPYIVDSYYTYGSRQLIKKTEPVIANQIELNTPDLYDYIIGGMIDASRSMPAKYSLGFDVAIKTGTPQVGANVNDQNSFFIGFAPADDPEIAFAGVVEHGEYSKYMIRDLILAYQECYGLNGTEPTKQVLPDEFRPVLSTTTTTTTTTAATAAAAATTVTTATIVQNTQPETTAAYQQPWTQPAEQPIQTTEPWTESPATLPPAPSENTSVPAPETSQEPDDN